MIRCFICGREFKPEDPRIIDCDICLKMICKDCMDSELHSIIDLICELEESGLTKKQIRSRLKQHFNMKDIDRAFSLLGVK